MSRVLAALQAACWVVVCCAVAQPRACAGVERRARAASSSSARPSVARSSSPTPRSATTTRRAHGYLTFLAQVGEDFPDPPKVVRSDELALEVYWRAPNLSKQRIVGRRDTLALPTNIAYHQDHLGIVQNNFPSIIRIGDGDEVRDVPHPLSEPSGENDYDFAINDSLSIRLPGRSVQVYELRVRPKDATQPRLVGALYIDRVDRRRRAHGVHLHAPGVSRQGARGHLRSCSRTRSCRGASGCRCIRRSRFGARDAGSTFPRAASSAAAGRSADYEINAACRSRMFAGGPEITSAPARELAQHQWTGRILDSLPSDVRAASDDDVRKVQEEARALVQQQALRARAGRVALGAQGVRLRRA